MSIPQPRKGDDARLYAAQTKAAAEAANQRLRDDGAFYGDVQSKFGSK